MQTLFLTVSRGFKRTRRGERRWKAFIKQEWTQRRAGKTGGVWWASVNRSNDRKSAWHEKEFFQRFGHAKSLCRNSTKIANDNQKELLLRVCQDVIECLQIQPFILWRIITGEETWNFEYDTETKRLSSQSQKPKSNWLSSSMWGRHCPPQVLATEPDYQSASLPDVAATYSLLSTLKVTCLLWQIKLWQLHHNKTLAHNALSTRQFLLTRNNSCRTGTISLFNSPCSEWHFSFSQDQVDHQGDS